MCLYMMLYEIAVKAPRNAILTSHPENSKLIILTFKYRALFSDTSVLETRQGRFFILLFMKCFSILLCNAQCIR